MVLMAGVALLLLAVLLALGLHRALHRPPLTRQRPPIVPLHLQFDTVPDTISSPNSVTLKGFTMHLEGVTDTKVLDGADFPEGQTGVVSVSTVHGLSRNHLRRSVSQLMDRKGGEEEEEDEWVSDPHFRAHDSGMFDEEFVDSVKGFSTVRKEHTMFTDTNL
ncbi:usherin [Hoplias malabaricus]|uniref:usherin n=1 Tax=Hoplias malabaricus TaxID=27720 RepID=UPI00346233BA